MSAPALPCAACGAPVSGNFCPSCGAAAGGRQCAGCQTALTPGARFCHHCGAPASPALQTRGRERTAWLVAGAVLLVSVGGIGWSLFRDAVPAATVPSMGNAGNVAGVGGVGSPTGPAPDISQMTPLERFTRLNDRVMQAAESGDSATVVNFTPMALGAYAQLDTIDVDLRYHAALLHAQVGDFAPALALADTIMRVAPGNLFGYVVQATIASLQRDAGRLASARQAFLAAWDREIALGRPEYLLHRNVLDAFRADAGGQ